MIRTGKRYYWLKLKDDFFDDDSVNWLEEQPNGKEYCLFYLKLCLKSLKKDGMLIREVGKMLIPYDVKKLSLITNTNEDTVVIAMQLLRKIGLVEVMENGALYMSKINNMIGSESTVSERVRKHREKNKLLQCNIQVTQKKQKGNTEIEKEKELDIDKDKNILSCKQDDMKSIINYLNETTNQHYRTTTKATTRLINARLKEGFTVSDFKTVIEKKANEWMKDPSMCMYLRPETLFGTKFEAYLNQPVAERRLSKEEQRDKEDEERREMLREYDRRNNGQDIADFTRLLSK